MARSLAVVSSELFGECARHFDNLDENVSFDIMNIYIFCLVAEYVKTLEIWCETGHDFYL